MRSTVQQIQQPLACISHQGSTPGKDAQGIRSYTMTNSEKSHILWQSAIILCTLHVSCAYSPPSSNPQPPQVTPTVDTSLLASDPATRLWALQTPFNTFKQHLGPYTYLSSYTLAWQGAYKDTEHTTHTQVSQDTAENTFIERRTHTQHMILFCPKQGFCTLQQNHGPLQTSQDPSLLQRWAHTATSDLAEAAPWFLKHLHASNPRPERWNTWHVLHSTLSFKEAPVTLPPSLHTVPAPSAWLEQTHISDVSGDLWVEAHSGIPLKINLQVRFETADRPSHPSQGTLTYQHTFQPYTSKAPLTQPQGTPLPQAPQKTPSVSFYDAQGPSRRR
jgi:hypothetical protein